jgi:Holliday junction DNA helicase RuvB
MPETIKEYYLNGLLTSVSRCVTITEQEEKKEIGELVVSPKFEEMIYMPNVETYIKAILEKLKRGEKFNLLLTGTAGTGKTSTAKMLACETNKPFVYLTGSMGNRKIVEMLMNSKAGSIVLIDEIHNMPERIAEILYPSIQDGEIYVEGKMIKLDLMFIGTTTEPEELPRPLLERFKQIELEELEDEQLRKILEKKGCNEDIALKLLNYSSNFRIISNLLEMIKLYGEVNEENLRKVFKLKSIDIHTGLSKLQDTYLDYLKKQEKASLRSLSLILRKSENYIKLEIEPELIRKGLVNITSRGREINPELAYHLEKMEKVKNVRFTEEDRKYAIGWLKDRKGITEALGSRYLELVNNVAEMIHNGCLPDEIDWGSFSDDKPIKESVKDNYICEL